MDPRQGMTIMRTPLAVQIITSDSIPPGEIWFATPVGRRVVVENDRITVVEYLRVGARIVDLQHEAEGT
jgi:hypothetical protein